jgi:Ca2+-binding RTX toxin-like protein
MTAPAAPPPSIQVWGTLWRLQADPAAIDGAADEWRRVARLVRDVADDVNAPIDRLVGTEWLGETAETFDQHRRTLLIDVYAEGDLADFAAARLEQAADALRSAQNLLAESWSRLVARVPASTDRATGRVTFHPADDADAVFVHRSIRDAEVVRADLDDMLLRHARTLDNIRREWQIIGSAVESVANGATAPFVLPPEATGTTVIRDGNTVVVNTGTGDDKVEVGVNPATGEQVVVVNGVATSYPPGTNIVIRTGEGDDEVTVAPGTKTKVTMLGGAGDDRVQGGAGDETILGGAGDDKVSAGEGNDRVSGGTGKDHLFGSGGDDTLDGGLGDDQLYGYSGDDQVSGGEGRDRLDGSTGADTLDGGAGDDSVSGGWGDDRVRGGADDDTMRGGQGRDTVHGGSGTDTAYTQHEDTVDAEYVGESFRVGGPRRPEP